MSKNKTYRTAVIGARGMGAQHAANTTASGRFQIVATCDINLETAQTLAGNFPGCTPYTDAAKMLAAVKPEMVVVATPTQLHAPLTLAAVDAGVRGVYCEKPMAVNYGDAKSMVEACRAHGVALAVNHQRRELPLFQTMRRMIAEGAIGDVQLILGSNAGDILSDGTHFVDTARYLAGDAPANWVFGQIFRESPYPANPNDPKSQPWTGMRYGHPVESGAFGMIQFANGIRAEVHHGRQLLMPMRWYQGYEIIGSKGRMLRLNDATQTFLIHDGQAGGYREVPISQPADVNAVYAQTMCKIFTDFAAMMDRGDTTTGHALCGESGLRDQEIVMAIYESARLHQKITLPLQQDRFPLEIMLEKGEI